MKNLIVTGGFKSGKTNKIMKVVDDLIKENKNLLIIDKTLEYYNKYYDELKNKGYEIKVLNFDDTTHSDSINIFKLSYDYFKNGDEDKAYEILNKIVKTLFKDNGSDPYWNNAAAALICGYIYKLFKLAKLDEINFLSVSRFLEVLENDNIKEITEYLLKSGNDIGYRDLSTTLAAPRETKLSILSVTKMIINDIVNYKNKLNIISNNDFDLKEFCTNEKKALFIIPNLENENVLINMIITEAYYACKNFYFILDSFDLLPKLDNFKNLFMNCNYKDIYMILGIRNLDRLIKMYDEEMLEVADIQKSEEVTEIKEYLKKELPILNVKDINTFDILGEIAQ